MTDGVEQVDRALVPEYNFLLAIHNILLRTHKCFLLISAGDIEI